MFKTGIVMFAMVLATIAAAEDAPVPPPPPIPEADSNSAVGEEVRIIQGKKQTVEEYRINGELYKVKIIPKNGPPYYLLYPHGEHGPAVHSELDDLRTPYWRIFSW